jgi:hypothetical protein
VLCVEDVLRVRCPPWAQGEGARDDDEEQEQQHQQMLELHCDQLRERSELEWSQFRDAAHTITPAVSSSSPTAAQGQPECWAPLQAALPPSEWDKDLFSPVQVCL